MPSATCIASERLGGLTRPCGKPAGKSGYCRRHSYLVNPRGGWKSIALTPPSDRLPHRSGES